MSRARGDAPDAEVPMAGDLAHYRAVPYAAFPVDRLHAVLVTPGASTASVVVGAVPFVLGLCLTPRTLQEHVAVVLAHSPNMAPDFATTTLDRLVRAGLLQPCPVATPAPPTQPSIQTLAVTTADRPGVMERCLESYLAAAQAAGRALRVVVCDGSSSGASATQNRLVAGQLASRFAADVGYLGRDARRGLSAALAARGLGGRPLEFSLRVGDAVQQTTPTGACRNALLLRTAGQAIILVGDDTQGRAWRRPERADTTIEVIGHADPRHYEFFTTTEAALPETAMLHGDIVEAHEQLLTCELTEVAAGRWGPCDAGYACGHMRALLTSAEARARVRVTSAGIAGDGGLTTPVPLLFLDGTVRRQMATDRDVFENAMLFRALRRVVRRPAITHDPTCDLACAALDNTRLLPPFAPSDGDSSQAFAATLGICDPAALFGHVPCGVIRVSDRPPYYDDGTSEHAVTVSDVLVAAAASAGLPPLMTSPAERMACLGRHYSAIAALAPSTCDDFLRNAVLDARCRQLVQLDQIEAAGEYPDYWRAAFGRYRTAALAGLDTPGFFVPTGLVRGGDWLTGLRRLQVMLADYGALLQWWPDAVAAARALVGEGEIPRATT